MEWKSSFDQCTFSPGTVSEKLLMEMKVLHVRWEKADRGLFTFTIGCTHCGSLQALFTFHASVIDFYMLVKYRGLCTRPVSVEASVRDQKFT